MFECWSLERFHFEGLGLRFCISFQTPIRASGLRSERQFDLLVSVKWNVDAVQSIGDERLIAGLMLGCEHAPRSKGFVFYASF